MQISFAWSPAEKKGELRGTALTLGSGKLHFSLLLLSSDLISDLSAVEMGCGSDEAPEKWERPVLAAFEGRWARTTRLSRSYLLRKGQENNPAKQLPGLEHHAVPSHCTPTCGEVAISHGDERRR